ncbi:MAG: DUF1761 domain-containing protein [Paracoccaceae bacterium]
MEYVIVLGAALASFAFGAVWYMALAKPWHAAAGIDVEKLRAEGGGGSAFVFVVAFLCCVLVAGMMRHVFHAAQIHTLGSGALAGLGLGLFIATPWIVMNNMFGMKPRMLTLIDGTYASVGCMIMGAVLGAFPAVA